MAVVGDELFPRSSGILLHPTSLPGPYGIGDLGPAAAKFVKFLESTCQSLWQMLPIGPTGYADSPYQSFSAFAGNPLLISFDRLIERGYLAESIRERLPEFSNNAVEFERVLPWKRELLAEAFAGFEKSAPASEKAAFNDYCRREVSWLDDFALYSALKDAHPGLNWQQWDADTAMRRPESLDDWRRKLAEPIRRCQFEQFEFDRQWDELTAICKSAQVRLMGDMPIYVAQDSADAWSHPELFKFDATGKPTVVAGVPPDYFSETGQLWGNPIYRWEEHERTGFAWWIERFRSAFARFDMLRVDHFRGFEAYWEVPAGEKTAVVGEWVKAPGAKLYAAVESELGKLPIVAENLGHITPEVEELRQQFGFPGMLVLQFGFASDDEGSLQFRPDNYPVDAVAYTGTHDNDTLVGWLSGSDNGAKRSPEQFEQEKARIVEYFFADGEALAPRILERIMASKAHTLIVPMQDVLGVGSEGRMNRPSITDGNWRWRFRPEQISAECRNYLSALTKYYLRAL